MAMPHRGSLLAGPRLARFVTKLVKMPVELVQVGTELVVQNPGQVALRSRSDIPSSVENMSPANRFIQVCVSIPVAKGVTAHSIIAVQGDGPVGGGDDGVVAPQSPHIEGVASELVVRSGHSLQSHSDAICEVRRILLDHMVETE